MNNQLQKTFLGKEIVFTPDGWINATQTIKVMKAKRLDNFIKSKYFTEYVKAFCKYHQLDYSDVVKTFKGNFSKSDHSKTGITQGTYFHPDLVVLFARWINPDFAVWCDTIIKQILTGDLEVRYKVLRKDYDQLEDKHDKLFEELRLYQRPDENNQTNDKPFNV
ncbi:KilA-N domain-containing protein [uncultured Microscilla sp.]|uniref:KilA-N domain-containing protein n=1 Tax=uncultured Microscilla sp. TaxID=432653 RepID=UPI00260A5FE1|nr:KilA-N domain-containing protein [uncultured Microscilla sp.]